MPRSIAAGVRRGFSRRFLILGVGAALAAGAALPSQAATIQAPDAPSLAAKPTGPTGGTWFGAHVNPHDGLGQLQAIHKLEGQIDRGLDVANKYHGFLGMKTSLSVEKTLISEGKVPMVSWRGTEDKPDGERAKKIVRGDYDDNIVASANALKALGGPVLLRFNWEMDQKPGARQYIGEPADFIAAWRHIHTIFQNQGATNVAFLWAPRASAFRGNNRGPAFYPGDDVVDWIGGSSVPIDTNPDFKPIYGDFYNWAHINHPLKPVLMWGGVTEDSSRPLYKAGWMDQVHSTLATEWTQVKAFVYYHAKSPTGSLFWADTTSQSLNAFANMGCDPYFHQDPNPAGECGT